MFDAARMPEPGGLRPGAVRAATRVGAIGVSCVSPHRGLPNDHDLGEARPVPQPLPGSPRPNAVGTAQRAGSSPAEGLRPGVRFPRSRVIGLVIGAVLGLAPYLMVRAITRDGGSFALPLIASPLVPFIVGTVMIFLHRFRWLGAGLLAGSIPALAATVAIIAWLIDPVIVF